MIIDPTKETALTQIVARLKSGEAVVIPTETVYGLAADANNISAIEKVFFLKKRPFDHPLIVHIATLSELLLWARDIKDYVCQLAQAFWPGPLTLILPKAKHVHTRITAGQETVGIRIPAHPVALNVLRAFGSGLVAPSANPFMALSPTTSAHVAQAFPADLWIVEGGAADVGLESTIIDCSGACPVIVRAGLITPEKIKSKTGLAIGFSHETHIKHAGQHKVHYAPNTHLRLVTREALNHLLESNMPKHQLGLLGFEPRQLFSGFKKSIYLPNKACDYAKHFYAALHELDQCGCSEIWVEYPPQNEEWQAIHERLLKAAAKFA